MSDMTRYQKQILAQLWQYRQRAFANRDGWFESGLPSLTRPPVFKTEYAENNILFHPHGLVAADDQLLGTLRQHQHVWLRSMRSSQALVLSFFGNLQLYNKLRLLKRVTDDDGRPLFPAALFEGDTVFELEHPVGHLGEKTRTSVDLMLVGPYRVSVECKLTESEVGRCSRPRLGRADNNYLHDHCDGSYTRQLGRTERCSLAERGVQYWQYIPELFRWPSDVDQQPCPLSDTYQLVRNVLAACVRPDGRIAPDEGHAVLIYDARNPTFGRNGNGWKAWQDVKYGLRDPSGLRCGTWQQLIGCLYPDPGLSWLIDALREKYGLEGAP